MNNSMPPLDTLSLTTQVLAEARLMTNNMEQDDGITCCSPRYQHQEMSDSSFRKLPVKPRDYIDDDSEGRDAIAATAATRECLLYKSNHHHPTNPSSSSSSSILPTHKKSNMLRGFFITTALSLTLLHLWHLPITLSTAVAGAWMSPITNRLVQQQQPPARPSIVLFGDSLTQQGFGTHGTIGWASLLASDYARRADVLNRGYSGYNTKMALQVWPSIRTVFGRSRDASSSVLFTTVFFGANDAVVPGTQQHVPLNEYRDNIETIVDNMQSAWAQQQQQQARDDDRESRTRQKVIFLVAPPPVDEQAWAAFRNSKQQQSSGVAPSGDIPHPPGTNRFNHVTNQYAQVVRDIVQERQNSRQDHPAVAAVALVDAWEILEGHNVTAYSQYLSDGLHLNERGNRKLYQGFMDLIQREYPWLAPDTSSANGENDGVPLEEKAWYEYD